MPPSLPALPKDQDPSYNLADSSSENDEWRPTPKLSYTEYLSSCLSSLLLSLTPLRSPHTYALELKGKMMVAGALENVIQLVNSNPETFHPNSEKWMLQRRRRMMTRIEASIAGGAAGNTMLEQLRLAEESEGVDGWPARLSPPEFAALQLSAQAGMQGVMLGTSIGVALFLSAPFIGRRLWPRLAPTLKESTMLPMKLRNRITIVPKSIEQVAYEEAHFASETAKEIATSKWAAFRLNIEHIGGTDGLKAAAEAAQKEADALVDKAALALREWKTAKAAIVDMERVARKKDRKKRWIKASAYFMLRGFVGGALGAIFGSIRAIDNRLWPVMTLSPSTLGDESRLVFREGFMPGSTSLHPRSDDLSFVDDGGASVAAASPFYSRVLQAAQSANDAENGRSFFFKAASSLPAGPYSLLRAQIKQTKSAAPKHASVIPPAIYKKN